MAKLTRAEEQIMNIAAESYSKMLDNIGVSVQVRHDFAAYRAIRAAHGEHHLNQVFDERHVEFSTGDFWLLAQNRTGAPIATYCMRRFVIDDFYDLIRSLTLWFSRPPLFADRRFLVDCQIPPFGGQVAHGGGLWIRSDYRGFSRLAAIMPRVARTVALRSWSFDHDSAMIRDDPSDTAEIAERKANYMGQRVYGYARVARFVDGWFPPEGRAAIMHLCHATKEEAISSLTVAPMVAGNLRRTELRKTPLIDQDYKPVYAPAILSKRQQQARI